MGVLQKVQWNVYYENIVHEYEDFFAPKYTFL